MKKSVSSLDPTGRLWKKFSISKAKTDYKLISDYGLIGDQRTCALVGLDSSIDWLCVPRFDSPSIFASILDVKNGGSFRILPENGYDEFEASQYYEGPTSILSTEIRDESGRIKITDFMPCFRVAGTMISTAEIHRRVSCLDGKFKAEVSVEPRMDYAKLIPKVNYVEDLGYSFVSPDPNVRQEVALVTRRKLQTGDGTVSGVLEMEKGNSVNLIFRGGGVKLHHVEEAYSDEKLRQTQEYFERWSKKTIFSGKWKEMVERSAITLKLLIYSPTGAIVAAPTTSLPEEIGGVRNWDYRYSWVRDSTFVLWAFHSIGHDEAEELYLNWIDSIYYLTAENLQVMLGVTGERDLTEMSLEHLEGYSNSPPVRIGNGAWDQFQLDVYGILVDAMYFSQVHRQEIDRRIYNFVLKLVIKAVEEKWDKPDCGIWEVRGEQQHFVYSKMWCWVALDRAVRIARSIGEEGDANRWAELRDKIREKIMEEGWDEQANSFVRAFGAKDLDAANLLMPQVRFISPRHPKMLATLDQTMEKLMENGKFVYRYRAADGLPGDEGAFLICSFWLVSCLALAGRIDEAEKLMDSLVEYANHLGLFSEEIDPKSGAMLGNFPQAFTHMGFISAAVSLARAMQMKREDHAP
jgi:GH15 family glucan-1,4-alpha-glucosidase